MPRLFLQHRNARLYGYKMSENRNKDFLVADIESCGIPYRNENGYSYLEIRKRVGALRINWVSYEDLLETQFGTDLDIVRRWSSDRHGRQGSAPQRERAALHPGSK